MSFRSTIARPTFTPALNVFSATAPVFRFRSFVRTNAPPFPGFTCWNSMIWNSVPSSSSVIPFLSSFVETLTCDRPSASQLDQLADGCPDDAAAVVADLHHVLDPYTAEPRYVHTGLHGHHRARRQHIVAAPSEVRPLVDVQA